MIAITLSIGLTAFILIIIGALVDKEEHVVLKLLNFCMATIFILLLGKVALDYQNNTCYSEIANTTIINDTTHYDYKQVCFERPDTTGLSFYKITLWYSRIFAFYVFIYLFLILKKNIKKLFGDKNEA